MGAVNVLVWPGPMSPVSNWPPVAVSVCVTESLLVTLTVEPGATVAGMGENMKLEMVMDLVVVASRPLDASSTPTSPTRRRCCTRPGAVRPPGPGRPHHP